MTITIDAPAEVETAIMEKAARAGMSVPEYTLRALLEKAEAGDPSVTGEAETDATRAFPPGATYHGVPIAGNPLAALFAQWAADDPVTGPEDLAQRQREGDEFMAGLQANRFTIPQDPELVAIIESMSKEASS